MKLFKITLIIFSILILMHSGVFAQQSQYQWRLGIHSGIMGYYGDLSHNAIDINNPLKEIFQNLDYLSYGISAEKSLSNSWGIRLSGSYGQFIAGDRSYNFKGDLNLSNPNLLRGFEVKSDIRDVSFMLTYQFDNGKVMGKRSFFSPYFAFGAGFTKFKTTADLFSGEGGQYYYWSDLTIRDEAETGMNQETADIVERDGSYETRLDGLRTEGVDYKTMALHIPVGIGLKFRFGDRFNFNIETLAKYTTTDYLDDVSGDYLTTYDNTLQEIAAAPGIETGLTRGNPDRRSNDIYWYSSISLHYNFGKKHEVFKAPFIYLSTMDESLKAVTAIPGSDPESVLKPKEPEILSEKRPWPVYPVEAEKAIEAEKADTIQDLKALEITTVIDTSSVVDLNIEEVQPLSSATTEIPLPDTIVVEDSVFDNPLLAEIEAIEVVKADSLPVEVVTLPANVVKADSLPAKVVIPDSVITITKEVIIPPNSGPSVDEMLLAKLLKENEALRIKLNEESRNLPLSEAVTPRDPRDVEIARLNAELIKVQFQTVNTRLDGIERSIRESSAGNVALTQPSATAKAENEALVRSVNSMEEELKKIKIMLTALTTAEVITSVTPDSKPTPPASVDLSPVISRLDILEKKISAASSPTPAPNNNQNEKVTALENQVALLMNEIKAMRAEAAKPAVVPTPAPVIITPAEPAKTVSSYERSFRGLELTNVFFKTGSSQVDPFYVERLQRIGQLVGDYGHIVISITGYADQVGNPDANLLLSKKRAESVKRYLMQYAYVRSDQIVMQFYGASQSSGDPSFDRRVEIRLLDK